MNYRGYYAVILSLLPVALLTSITATDFLVVLLLVGWVLEHLLTDRAFRVDRVVAWAVGAYFLLGLVPALVTVSVGPLEEFVVHHFRKLLLLVVLLDVMGDRLEVRRSMNLWIGVTGLAVGLSLAAYFMQEPFLGRFVRMEDWLQFRITGPGGWQPNTFANVLACVLPFALFTAEAPSEKTPGGTPWVRWACASAAVLIGAGIMFTFTRMVMLSSAVLLMVVVGRLPRKKGLLILLVVLILAGFFVTYYTSAEFMERRFGAAYEVVTGQRQHRLLTFWKVAIPTWAQDPWRVVFGGGPGRGMEALRGMVDRSVWMLEHRNHAHNNLLQMWLDYGLFGLLAYGILWGAVIDRLVRGASWDFAAVCGLGLAFVVNVNGLTEFNWGRSMAHYNIVFGLAIVLRLRALAGGSSAPTPSSSSARGG